jgi:hypothetical protein
MDEQVEKFAISKMRIRNSVSLIASTTTKAFMKVENGFFGSIVATNVVVGVAVAVGMGLGGSGGRG